MNKGNEIARPTSIQPVLIMYKVKYLMKIIREMYCVGGPLGKCHHKSVAPVSHLI